MKLTKATLKTQDLWNHWHAMTISFPKFDVVIKLYWESYSMCLNNNEIRKEVEKT